MTSHWHCQLGSCKITILYSFISSLLEFFANQISTWNMSLSQKLTLNTLQKNCDDVLKLVWKISSYFMIKDIFCRKAYKSNNYLNMIRNYTISAWKRSCIYFYNIKIGCIDCNKLYNITLIYFVYFCTNVKLTNTI